MRNKKRFGALLLAGAMALGMCMNTTVFAEKVPTVGNQEGTEQQPASAGITKRFEMAEGLDVPDATFKFTVKKAQGNDGPEATISNITYLAKENKGKVQNGKYAIEKNADITFKGEFPHAGEYVYTVKEKDESMTNPSITYSEEQYTLRVRVANGANNDSLYIKDITAERDRSNGTETNKVAKISFTNTYRKNVSLKITKTTTGTLADKTKKFNFKITFAKSATEDTIADFQGTITRKGSATTETVICKNGSATFTLADGDALKFENLPAGTKYTVTEVEGEKDGYTPYVTVTDNGIRGQVINGTDGTNLSSSQNGNYAGEKGNIVEFENKYVENPATGIIMNNLPFILLIGVAVLAFGTLAFVKKRRTSGR